MFDEIQFEHVSPSSASLLIFYCFKFDRVLKVNWYLLVNEFWETINYSVRVFQ